MLDVVHRSGQIAFGDGDDPVRNILRVQSVIVPDNADHGDVDIRKDVCGGAKNRQPAEDENQNSEYREGVWPLQC